MCGCRHCAPSLAVLIYHSRLRLRRPPFPQVLFCSSIAGRPHVATHGIPATPSTPLLCGLPAVEVLHQSAATDVLLPGGRAPRRRPRSWPELPIAPHCVGHNGTDVLLLPDGRAARPQASPSYRRQTPTKNFVSVADLLILLLAR